VHPAPTLPTSTPVSPPPGPPAWLCLNLFNLSSPWVRACCSLSAHDVSPPAFCQLPEVPGCCEVLLSVLDERDCEALELGAGVLVSYFCQPLPVFLYTLPLTSA